jgi:hypothetical protein
MKEKPFILTTGGESKSSWMQYQPVMMEFYFGLSLRLLIGLPGMRRREEKFYPLVEYYVSFNHIEI